MKVLPMETPEDDDDDDLAPLPSDAVAADAGAGGRGDLAVTPVATENEPGRRSKLPHTAALVALGLVVVLVSAIAVALFLTSKPSFFARYKALTRRYDTLQTSVHRDLACNDCHTDKGGPVVHEAGLVGDFYTSLFSKQREPLFTKMVKPPRDGLPEVPQGRLELELEADFEGSAPRPPAREHREARLRHVPQVDGARRGVHGEAQEDAVLRRLRHLRMSRRLEERRRVLHVPPHAARRQGSVEEGAPQGGPGHRTQRLP